MLDKAFSSCHPSTYHQKHRGRNDTEMGPYVVSICSVAGWFIFPPEHRILAAKGLFLMGLSLWGTAIAFGVMGSWEGVGTCENRLVVHPGPLAGRGMPR